MFQETYRHMNDALSPSPALREETLSNLGRRPRRATDLPRRVLALAAAAALCLSTTALAAQTETGYQLLYAVAPAAAQFFQPVQRSCTAGGVTMEVVAVRVDGDTAQAYITLTGDAVDGTTDLFDSYNFHLPDHQIGHCERVAYDEPTHTATFLCTTKTMDGRPIRPGGKMTFSLDRFLSGKESAENLAIDLDLSNYAAEAPSHQIYVNGGSYDPDVYTGSLDHYMTALVPQAPITSVMENLAITAVGYADGMLHIQLAISRQLELDPNGWLYLVDENGERIERYYTISTTVGENEDGTYSENQIAYVDFVFNVPPADLPNYTLHGDFYSAAHLTEGPWRITFPLETT